MQSRSTATITPTRIVSTAAKPIILLISGLVCPVVVEEDWGSMVAVSAIANKKVFSTKERIGS